MGYEQTTRTLADLKDQVEQIIADRSGRHLEDADIEDHLEEAASNVAFDLDHRLLPHLHTRDTFTTTTGTNTYSLSDILSYTVVKIITLAYYGFPVIPISWQTKLTLFGNVDGDNEARPPVWYDRGSGNIELYRYGTSTTDYPGDVQFSVEYVRQPTLSTTIPFSDTAAGLIVARAVVHAARSIREHTLGEEYLRDYMNDVQKLNAEIQAPRIA